jgi:hypothetical protein
MSDLIITAAYYAIPVLLLAVVRKRRDFTFNWIVAAFAAFILACGTTTYRASGRCGMPPTGWTAW